MGKRRNIVALITSSEFGEGEKTLGTLLMRSFIKSLAMSDEPPTMCIFINSGVKLTTKGSPAIKDLISLQDGGCSVASCGTCLDFYNLKNMLEVGEVGNMADTVRYLSSADVVIRP